jgi:hypothetical protein
VFECVYQHCNWISPSLSHCNIFAMHTHLHIFFSLYTMTPFPTCYTTTFLFFHLSWSIPTFIQSILTFHIYTSPHILCVTGCAEHSGAQVYYTYIEIYHKYTISTFKYIQIYFQIYSNTFKYTLNTLKYIQVHSNTFKYIKIHWNVL